MDSSRDNLFTRFTTFWWALGTFLLFGVLLLLVWSINTKDSSSVDAFEAKAAEARYKTKDEIFKAQAAAIPADAIHTATEKVAKELVASRPAPVKTDAQKVPTAAVVLDATGINKAAAASTETPDTAVLEKGKGLYLICSACHGQAGEGLAMVGPPLANSEWVTGPVSNLVNIGDRGLIGPITVAGKEHTEFPAGMMAMAASMPDEDFAAVLTYIRNSFGNKASPVKAEWVTALRAEIKKAGNAAQLPTSELIKPAAK